MPRAYSSWSSFNDHRIEVTLKNASRGYSAIAKLLVYIGTHVQLNVIDIIFLKVKKSSVKIAWQTPNDVKLSLSPSLVNCYWKLATIRRHDAIKTSCGFLFRFTVNAEEHCEQVDGYYASADKSCYYNGSHDGNACPYSVNRKCYQYVEPTYTASTCANIGGFFTTISLNNPSGRLCYYNQFNCTYHTANHQCYKYRTLVNNPSECDNSTGYFQHGYCYND